MRVERKEPERGESVLGNAAWIIGCKVVQAVLQLVITMLTARYLGPTYYGVIAYASSVIAFAVPVMQLGLRNTMIQELISFPDKKGEILGTGLFMNFVSSLFCIVGVFCFSAVANPGDVTTVIVCVLYSGTLALQAVEIVQYWFQERLMSKFVSASMLFAYVVSASYQAALLIAGEGVFWFAVAQSLQHFVIACALLILYRRKGGQKLKVSLSLCAPLFSRSKHFVLSNLMITVFLQTDRVMLDFMVDSAAVGYYSAAVTCANMTNFVFLAIIDSFRPVILDKGLKDDEELDAGVKKLFCIVSYMAIVQALAFTLLAWFVIGVMYGSQYSPAVPVLQVLGWCSAFAKVGLVRDVWVLAKGRQSILWKVNICGAVANVVLNFVLIPIMGLMGAALASFVAQFITSIVSSCVIPSVRRCGWLLFHSLDPKALKEVLESLAKRRLF